MVLELPFEIISKIFGYIDDPMTIINILDSCSYLAKIESYSIKKISKVGFQNRAFSDKKKFPICNIDRFKNIEYIGICEITSMEQLKKIMTLPKLKTIMLFRFVKINTKSDTITYIKSAIKYYCSLNRSFNNKYFRIITNDYFNRVTMQFVFDNGNFIITPMINSSCWKLTVNELIDLYQCYRKNGNKLHTINLNVGSLLSRCNNLNKSSFKSSVLLTYFKNIPELTTVICNPLIDLYYINGLLNKIITIDESKTIPGYLVIDHYKLNPSNSVENFNIPIHFDQISSTMLKYPNLKKITVSGFRSSQFNNNIDEVIHSTLNKYDNLTITLIISSYPKIKCHPRLVIIIGYSRKLFGQEYILY